MKLLCQVLFVAPEIVANKTLKRENWTHGEMSWRVMCVFGSLGNVVLMMGANLVGFALGVDGVRDLVRGVVGWGGVGTVVACAGSLFAAVMVMKEIRAGEKRRGVDIKC